MSSDLESLLDAIHFYNPNIAIPIQCNINISDISTVNYINSILYHNDKLFYDYQDLKNKYQKLLCKSYKIQDIHFNLKEKINIFENKNIFLNKQINILQNNNFNIQQKANIYENQNILLNHKISIIENSNLYFKNTINFLTNQNIAYNNTINILETKNTNLYNQNNSLILYNKKLYQMKEPIYI